MHRVTHPFRSFLSHRPALYAFIVGASVVLFWRGIWHSADTLHHYLQEYYLTSTIDFAVTPWWDGPLSLFVGSIILWLSGAFTSSFIGNELILSGLRGEKKLSERTESEVKTEGSAISDIKDELYLISKKMEQLEKIHNSNHHSS